VTGLADGSTFLLLSLFQDTLFVVISEAVGTNTYNVLRNQNACSQCARLPW